MKKRAVGLAPIVMLVLSGCANVQLAQAKRDFALQVPWAGYERLEVRVTNGGVEVRVDAVQDVQITGTKQAGGATLAEAEENVEQVTVYAGAHSSRPGTFLVELRYPDELRHKNVGAKLVVRVPQACPGDVRTTNGSIRVVGLKDEVVVGSTNGSLHVEDVEGTVRAETSNGSISAEKIGGTVRARSTNGTLAARDIDGACDLHTTNGSIRASDVRGSVTAETTNGGITVAAAPAADGCIALHSSNANIELALPRDLAASLVLDTSNGRITTVADESTLSVTERSKTHMKAAMNGGGCPVTAETSNGSIKIEAR